MANEEATGGASAPGTQPWAAVQWPLVAGRTALVVIDPQNDFLHDEGWYAASGVDVAHMQATIGPIRDLVAAGPIECHPRPGEVTYGRIVATCIVAGQDLALALLRAGQAAPWCSYLRGDPLEQSYLAAAAMADGPPAKPRHRCPSRRPSP